MSIDNDLIARLDERQQAMDDKLDAILEQTKKTNGRLLVAEDSIDKINLWKAQVVGSLKTLLIVGAVAGAIIGWVIDSL